MLELAENAIFGARRLANAWGIGTISPRTGSLFTFRLRDRLAGFRATWASRGPDSENLAEWVVSISI
jgi:hypothetical protein